MKDSSDAAPQTKDSSQTEELANNASVSELEGEQNQREEPKFSSRAKLKIFQSRLNGFLKSIYCAFGKGVAFAVRFFKASCLKAKQCALFRKHRKASLIIGAVAFFLIVLLIIWACIPDKTKVHHGPTSVGNLIRINNIQNELSQIQSQVSDTTKMTVAERQVISNRLQTVDSKLSQVSKISGVRQGAQIKSLRATIQSSQVNLSQKIGALSSEIKRIKHKVFPAPTLGANSLPFKVVSIEPWNGKPYIEIQQKNNSTMISYVGLYGVRGGWKVIDINLPEQSATFLNEASQVVHVQVNFKSLHRGA